MAAKHQKTQRLRIRQKTNRADVSIKDRELMTRPSFSDTIGAEHFTDNQCNHNQVTDVYPVSVNRKIVQYLSTCIDCRQSWDHTETRIDNS